MKHTILVFDNVQCLVEHVPGTILLPVCKVEGGQRIPRVRLQAKFSYHLLVNSLSILIHFFK